MIVILASLEIAPGDLDRAEGLARTLAAETCKEPGCLLYAVASDLSAPGTLRLSEWWRDAEALARHFETPHMLAFRQEMRGMRLGRVDIKRFDVSAVADLDPRNPATVA